MENYISKTALVVFSSLILFSCNDEKYDKKIEQLTINEFQTDTLNSISSELISSVNNVVLTGIDKVRLLTFYKIKPNSDRNLDYYDGSSYDYYKEFDDLDEERYRYFMPGMDIITGYNLVNVGHYNSEKDTLTYFFQTPAIIRTLYFPGVKKDSLNGNIIKRNYFMISAYDEDTNNDSLINKRDMRRIYHFDELNIQKTSILPKEYSAIRSDYDYKNDVMYIYARFDQNKNGTPERTEPISVFWIRLSEPTLVRKMI